MRFALGFVFDQFNIGLKFEGSMAAQITIGCLAAFVLYLLYKRHKLEHR